MVNAQERREEKIPSPSRHSLATSFRFALLLFLLRDVKAVVSAEVCAFEIPSS